MVKRRTAHLFIGFLRKTVLFPWTELPRLRGSRAFFWALGAVAAGQSSLSGGRACACGIMACHTLAVADPLRLATRKACLL